MRGAEPFLRGALGAVSRQAPCCVADPFRRAAEPFVSATEPFVSVVVGSPARQVGGPYPMPPVRMPPFPARLGNRGYIKPLENRPLFPRDWEIAVT